MKRKSDYTFTISNEIKEDALLTTEQLSEVLNIALRTLRRWHFTGFLRGIKIGGLVRYRWGDVQQWVGDKQEATTVRLREYTRR